MECLSKDSEILTEKGWDTIDNLKEGEKVATFNQRTKRIEYQPILRIFKQEYSGEMIRLKNFHTDQLLTPNHRVLLKYRTHSGKKYYNTTWQFIRAENLDYKSGLIIPVSAKYKGVNSIGEDLAELIGWILTDGTLSTQKGHRITIFQSKEKGIKRIFYLLNRLGIKYNIHKRLDKSNLTENPKERYYIKFSGEWARKIRGIIPKKTLTPFLFHLKENSLKRLFEGIYGGDGSGQSIYGKPESFRDNLQILLLHLGMRTIWNKEKQAVEFSNRTTTFISRRNKRNNPKLEPYGISKENYEGIVWCVKTQAGTFIARRNKKVFITGNSTLDLYLSHLWQITDELYRVLKPTGIMFWNHGDSYFTGKGSCYNPGGGDLSWKSWNDRKGIYSGTAPNRMSKEGRPKCLALQNYRLILGMTDTDYRILVEWRAMGKPTGKLEDMLKNPRMQRILRNAIIWNKPNHMPSSVKDRFANSYEPVFMLTKNNKPQYYYNIKTGLMADSKPKELKEGIDWEWREVGQDYSESDTKISQQNAEKMNSPRARVYRGKKQKKVSLWRSLSYWFDLDAVRVEQTEQWKKRTEKIVERPKPKGIKLKGEIVSKTYQASLSGKNPGDVFSVPIANYYVEIDGKFYKVSPDCPIHSPYLGHEIPQKVFYGEQQGYQKNDISDISNHPVEGHTSESVSIPSPDDLKNQKVLSNGHEQISQNISENKISEHFLNKVESQNHHHIQDKLKKSSCNLDYPHPSDSEIAISHNKQKNKNISSRVLNDNASDKISCHKSDKKQPPQVSELGLPYLNFNQKKCTCQETKVEHLATKPDIWRIPTQSFKEAHFATFPEKLVEPMIKSSCPQWICRKCGKSRVRIVETYNPKGITGRAGKPMMVNGIVDLSKTGKRIEKGHNASVYYSGKFIGWTDCGCNAGWTSGIVLDPFCGAGTSLIVAKKLGRHYIGIEIKKEYKDMADRRLIKTVCQQEFEL